MKRTLLDLTQNILGAMNSDEVNSIGDTVESSQVAEAIRTTYFNILGRAELPEHNKLFQLTGAADVTRPVLMLRPEEGVTKLEWVKYFNTNLLGSSTSGGQQHDTNVDLTTEEIAEGQSGPQFQYVQILDNQTFLDMVNMLNPNESNVKNFMFQDFMSVSEKPDTFLVQYRNDKQPSYCTVVQNYYFIFDSFDNTQDSTLQSSKSQCFGFITPTFTMTDTFVPDLDDWAFPLLLNEAKALAFYELKQTIHPQAEREIDRQWSALQKTKAIVNKPSWFDQLPNFGRRRGTY
jgi:hypothetical protein